MHARCTARYFRQKGMDMKTMILRTLTCVAVSLFATSTMAQVGITGGAKPGMVGTAHTITIKATVVAVDKAMRDVTLKGPQGNELTVTAGADVKNFDAIKVGDVVNATYKQALTVELKKGGGMAVGRAESQKGAMKLNSGETVSGTVGRRVTIVADVVAVDPATQVVTLRGAKHTVDMVVADREQFNRVAKGDQVEVTYIQAFAAALDPAK